MKKQIQITIKSDGSTKVDALNFQGKGCASATEGFELALAGRDPSNRKDDKKAEYFQSASTSGTLKN